MVTRPGFQSADAERTLANGSSVWKRVFETVPDNLDYDVDEIEGILPAGLRGTLYRNGPGKLEIAGKPFAHLFDGDGMVSQFILDGGRARYRTRFVRTNHYLGGLGATAPRFRGFGEQRPGGPLANAFRFPQNTANTSVTLHAGKLLALWEGGHPWQLDPDTLETVGEHDFDGRLKATYFFSAHPKRDPLSGELFNFGMQYGPRPRIRCYRIDVSGRLHHLATVGLPHPVLNHDFALTERHLVFVIDPIVLRLWRFVLGVDSLDGALRFDGSKATRVVLVPRDGGPARVAECEPFFHFHVNNAFEDGNRTVVDLVRYADFGVGESVRHYQATPFGPAGALWRLTISRSGQVDARPTSTWPVEFPQHDQRRTTRAYRYSYVVGQAGRGALATAVIKHDHDSGATWAHELGPGELAGEAIFVPRTRDAAEDDGWLLSIVYSAAQHRSRLLVLDARDPEADPVAVAHLRNHVPLGFHGIFTDRVAAPPPSG